MKSKNFRLIDYLCAYKITLLSIKQVMSDVRMVNISDAAKYVGLSLLVKGYSVSPLKLQKILYYAQAWHMVFFGRKNTLFPDVPQAWVNGPVYPSIYNEYKDKVPGMCAHLDARSFGETDERAGLEAIAHKLDLTARQVELLESVINLYGSKKQNQLILFTHSEKPWTEKREGLQPYEKSNEELSLDTMYSYYKERHDRNRERQGDGN